jgi:hypothetical protein
MDKDMGPVVVGMASNKEVGIDMVIRPQQQFMLGSPQVLLGW